MTLFYVRVGQPFKNKGVQAVLDSVVEYLPSPTEVAANSVALITTRMKLKGVREADDKAPFSAALAFKIATDPFVGTR